MGKVHHIDYFGMPGSGPTVAAAKLDAGRKIERLLNDLSNDPVIVTFGSWASMVWRGKHGWCSALIGTPDGFRQSGGGMTIHGSTTTRGEVLESAHQHVAQLAWSPLVENDAEFASQAGLELRAKDEFLRWTAWQRRYAEAIARGANANDAHHIAGGMMPMPVAANHYHAGGERCDDGWSQVSPDDVAAYDPSVTAPA